jgi:hypothetical protein
MSVLQFPRLYFRGATSWDPGLANNYEFLFDAERVELRPPPDGSDDVKQFILQNIGKEVQVGGESRMVGIWNYYGTHDAVFDDVAISGGVAAPGGPLIKDDPLVGSRIALRGKLVDLDAASTSSSQLFYDGISIGDSTLGISGAGAERVHARWINLDRNLSPLIIAGFAAATWQMVIAKDELRITGHQASTLLGLFSEALLREEVAGIMLRFQTYRTLYFQNGIRNRIPQRPRTLDELRELYQRGENFSNPAYSVTAGTVGLWMRDDTRSAPGGRYLVPGAQVATAVRRDGQEVPVTLGPAVAELSEDGKTLSLDLGATIPEKNVDLDKAALGDLEVVVQHGGEAVPVATIPQAAYGREAYEASAGIVDLDLSGEIVSRLREGRLVIRCRVDGVLVDALAEDSLVVVAENRDVYLDEGDVRGVPLRVFELGRPAPAGTQVLVSKYDRKGELLSPVGALVTDAQGAAELRLEARTPGIVTYGFQPFRADDPPPQPQEELDPRSGYYVNVRTLPFDGELERSTPDSALTFPFVYETILRVYDALNPVMARTTNPPINKPLDQRAWMIKMANAIRAVIAKDAFEKPFHMPITRDMSAGRRRLLERWCDLVLSGKAPEGATAFGAAGGAALPPDPRTVLS